MIETEFDALEKNIQYWYMIYQTIHKKITDAYINKSSAKEIDFLYNDKEYRNAITQLQRVKKKYGTIDITDIKDLHR